MSEGEIAYEDWSKRDLRGSEIAAIDPVTTPLSGTIIDVDQAGVVASALGMTASFEPIDA